MTARNVGHCQPGCKFTFDGSTGCDTGLKQVKTLLALELPKDRVGLSVVPSDRSFLHLDCGTGRPLGVVLEDLLDLRHPAHVKRFGHVYPLIAARSLDERSVLCRHSEVGHHAPVLLQEGTVTTRNKPDDVLGVLSEVTDGSPGSVSWDCLRRDLDNGSECALQA